MAELERRIEAEEVPEMAVVAGILFKLAKRLRGVASVAKEPSVYDVFDSDSDSG